MFNVSEGYYFSTKEDDCRSIFLVNFDFSKTNFINIKSILSTLPFYNNIYISGFSEMSPEVEKFFISRLKVIDYWVRYSGKLYVNFEDIHSHENCIKLINKLKSIDRVTAIYIFDHAALNKFFESNTLNMSPYTEGLKFHIQIREIEIEYELLYKLSKLQLSTVQVRNATFANEEIFESFKSILKHRGVPYKIQDSYFVVSYTQRIALKDSSNLLD